MFEVPEAKRVRRSDLYSSPPSSRDQSPALTDAAAAAEAEARLNAHFASLYGSFSTSSKRQAATKSKTTQDSDRGESAIEHDEVPRESGGQIQDVDIQDTGEHIMDGPEEQAYEFRLFSTPSTQPASHVKSTQKIVLEDEVEDVNILGEAIIHGDGAFMRDRKDPRVWTVAKASGKHLEELQYAAVSGESVVRRSSQKNWGLEVPWRVRIVKQRTAPLNGLSGKIATVAVEEQGTKKRKPGKKRRVVLRMRIKKVEEERTRKEREAKEKEENDKERKTRKNREKKVKQKLRAKAKAAKGKEAAVGEVDQSADVE